MKIFFIGRMVIDGVEMEKCLMQLVCDTQLTTNKNNVIAFSDNSSAIEGFTVNTLLPTDVGMFSELATQSRKRHITFTAETHNFPTGNVQWQVCQTSANLKNKRLQAFDFTI